MPGKTSGIVESLSSAAAPFTLRTLSHAVSGGEHHDRGGDHRDDERIAEQHDIARRAEDMAVIVERQQRQPMNVAPFPGLLWAVISPWWNKAIFRATASPMPEPSYSLRECNR